MRTIALAAALALAAAPALAQPKKDGNWRGSLTLSLSLSSGNTESTNASLAAEAARATGRDKVTLSAKALRGESETAGVTTKTAALYQLGGRYDRDLNDRLFAFGSAGLERDELQRLDLRSSLGAGLGWHAIATPETTFDLFAGVGATREEYATRSRSFTEVVIGEESSHRITDTTTFSQKLSLFPNLEESGEYRANFDATLATAIAAGWTFNVTLTHRHVSDPQPGLEKGDTLLLVGVASKFGPK